MSWTILKGPSGISVNERTGLVTWTYTYGSSTAYEIQVRASNIIGQHAVSWSLQVPLSYSAGVDKLEPSGVLPAPRFVRISGHVVFNNQLSPRVVPVNVV